MTTTVKVTGVNVEDAKNCLMAALEYLTAAGSIKEFSLTVKPIRERRTDEAETLSADKVYSFGLQTNGKVV